MVSYTGAATLCRAAYWLSNRIFNWQGIFIFTDWYNGIQAEHVFGILGSNDNICHLFIYKEPAEK
jgi:hypothetical protein